MDSSVRGGVAGARAALSRLPAGRLRSALAGLGARSVSVDARLSGAKKELVWRLVEAVGHVKPAIGLEAALWEIVEGGEPADDGGASELADAVGRVKAEPLRQALAQLASRAGADGLSGVDVRVTGRKRDLARRLVDGWAQVDPAGCRQRLQTFILNHVHEHGSAKRARPEPGPYTSAAGPSRQAVRSRPPTSPALRGHWPLRVDRARLDRAAHQAMHIIGRPSHTHFKVLGASGYVYAVRLTHAAGPSCSCPDHQTRRTTCKHILFVLMRVLGLSKQDLVHGVDASTIVAAASSEALFAVENGETSDVIDLTGQEPSRAPARKPRQAMRGVAQRPVDPEDSCPICCCDFGEAACPGSASLMYCRAECGKSLHRACFQKMEEYHRRKRSRLECPMCRHAWV